MPYSAIRPALVGVDTSGRLDLLADDDGPALGPTWVYNPDGSVKGLAGPSGTPAGVPIAILRSAIPVGRAPSGTMAANGALTVGTSLTKTYSIGVWLYFLAGAVYSGSPAGFYWVVMDTDLVGTVYDNIYDPTTQVPYIPETPTPIVAAGPGAYVGAATNVTTHQVTVPGGLMGPNGILQIEVAGTHNNSASNKGYTVRFAGTTIGGSAAQTTTQTQRNLVSIVNINEGMQYAAGTIGTANADVINRLAVNTTQPQNITIVVGGSTATDWGIMHAFIVEVIPS